VKKPKADGPVPCLLDVFDVARHLKMNPGTVRRLIRSHRVPGIRLERRLYVDERDLVGYIEAGRLRDHDQERPTVQRFQRTSA
jgi:hypothetical protein